MKKNLNNKNTNYHHGNLKEELINEAINVLQNDGEKKLTLSLLAKRLNITPPAVYRHFSSKEDLIHNVLLHGFGMYDEIILSIYERKDKTREEKHYLIGKAYIDFAIKYPTLFKLLFGKRFQNICNIENREHAKALYATIDLILEGQKEGEVKKDDPLQQATVMHSFVHGLATLYINDYPYVEKNIYTLYDTAFKTVMKGIQA